MSAYMLLSYFCPCTVVLSLLKSRNKNVEWLCVCHEHVESVTQCVENLPGMAELPWNAISHTSGSASVGNNNLLSAMGSD